MNRKIKFRAWDSKRKEWLEYDSGSGGWHINPETGAAMFDEDNSCSDPDCCGGPNPYWVDSRHIEVTQYIYLKDKKGKEIYEGDILKDELGVIIFIKWVSGVAGFRWIRGNKFLFDFAVGPETMSKCEIIGNEFENPELMENVL